MKLLLSLAVVVPLADQATAQCGVQKLNASSPNTDAFGFGVAVSGNHAVVGAVRESTFGFNAGAAYVFGRTSSGWVETDSLFGSDSGSDDNDLFGAAVDIEGDTIIVGAPGDGYKGAAYVFEYDGSAWIQTAKITASDLVDNSYFGGSVALNGNRALISAERHDNFVGAAYVFERSGSTWMEIQKLVPSDGQPNDIFGFSVALDDGSAIVGAYRHGGSGAAYLFDGSAGWTQAAKLVPSDSVSNMYFGISVAIADATAAIGAYGDDTVTKGAGAAYVFERGGGGWAQAAKLLPGDGSHFGFFGRSIAIGPLGIVVGARAGDDPGSAYLFIKDGSLWRHAAVVTGDDAFNDEFGTSVAVDGENVLVGANDGSGPYGDLGAVYVYQFPMFSVPYCFGTGCPCGNDDPVSGGCANSVPGLDGDDQGTLLAACGSGSVATDDLVLTLSHLPPNKFGLFYMGGGQTQVPFGDGFQCVRASGLGIFRYNPPQSSGSGGMLTLGPGIVARSQSFAMNGRIDAGETWYFQGWYRDPMGPCGTGFNLSNALAVTFAP